MFYKQNTQCAGRIICSTEVMLSHRKEKNGLSTLSATATQSKPDVQMATKYGHVAYDCWCACAESNILFFEALKICE